MSLILSGAEHRSNGSTHRPQPVYASARALELVVYWRQCMTFEMVAAESRIV
jgi:hypothetical protein